MIYAFLSSPVRGLRDIRGDIHDLALPDGRTVWVDEIDNPRTLTDPAFVTVDDLFARIREASVLLILLGSERHGTGLEIAGHAAHVSYWETELFYAMLLGKDVQVFELEGFAPELRVHLSTSLHIIEVLTVLRLLQQRRAALTELLPYTPDALRFGFERHLNHRIVATSPPDVLFAMC